MASHRNHEKEQLLGGDRPTSPLNASSDGNRPSPSAQQGGLAKAGAVPTSPAIVTALIVAAWYFCNIGVLLLNKYLLSFYGFK